MDIYILYLDINYVILCSGVGETGQKGAGNTEIDLEFHFRFRHLSSDY